ncbi:EAL domain-containing protein [Natronosporangium hydrolyticum]|uniref:EAL domain-containing protein n=1 Tax=Natronosporangium hydrolyticum TaxID=2811111 RepID=A0A895YBH8_9ACTN|nr:EAL domain-containing protein [Natronosporangium hydrolyticum]QSB13635.1 EAL domain-containing protein [Natronosporangium hydrolyticum]
MTRPADLRITTADATTAGADRARWLTPHRIFATYLVLAGGLAAAAIVLSVDGPPLLSSGARLLAGAAAVAAMVIGVLLHRPVVKAGWWLVVAGSVAGLLATGAGFVSTAQTGDFQPEEWSYAALAAAQLPLYVAGLALLARLGGRGTKTDLLDAVTIGLATFLVLFALVIRPVVPPGSFALLVAISLPLGALLLLAMVVRLLLSVGVPNPALGLLLLGMLTRVAATVTLLVPALTSGSLQVGPLTRPLSVISYLLLGAALLHPSLRHTRPRPNPGDDAVSKRRMAVLAIFAVVAPVAVIIEVRQASEVDAVGVTMPLVAAAGLLLLLVGRLGITADMAQRRAAELARRSEDLAQAVADQQELQQQLRHQALHDPLTGLANRLMVTERLEWALHRTGAGTQALILLDLDRFKDVNDTLGHPAGDELLVEISHQLLAITPAGSTLARLGGDEFAVLVEETSPSQARQLADQLRRALRQPYRIDGQELALSTSVGLLIAEPTIPRTSAANALRDADVALSAAKAAGRDRVVQFRPELRTAQRNVSRLSAGLRRALAEDEFAVHYQPVVDTETGQVAAVEALARWQPPDRPAVSPAEFIPVAEETGLIRPLGAWVLRQACLDARPWYDQHAVGLAVNVSPQQLTDPDFADLVLSALREAGLPGNGLIVEVTESSLVATAANSDTLRQLDRLREHGVRVAIDDFGTGYSSLAYVARLPVDIVKLDRSFVQHPPQATPDGQGWAFTRAVLQLVESLQLQAIAEGVETLDQLEQLRALRCRLVQGFLFGRPMPGELIVQSLTAAAEPPAPATAPRRVGR